MDDSTKSSGKSSALSTSEALLRLKEIRPATQSLVFRILSDRRGRDRVVRVQKERVVLGSLGSADVRVSGPGVSPIHAVIEISPDSKYMIYDLASESGLHVNGLPVVSGALQPNDEIRLGEVRIRFSIIDLTESKEDLSALLLENAEDVREIFDYSPSSKQAVEVVMSWANTILDIKHFGTAGQVTIGPGRDADFAIPGSLTHSDASRTVIVSCESEEFILHLDPKMTGVIFRSGKIQRVAELTSKGTQVKLGRTDFAKLELGEIHFYISSTQSPPKLKSSRGGARDPLFFRIVSGSLLLSAISIFSMFQMKIPQTLETEQIPDRIATVIFQPEKYQLTPKASERLKKLSEQVKSLEKKPEPKPTTVIKIDPNQTKPPQEIPKEMTAQTPDKANVTKKQAASGKKAGAKASQKQAKEGEGARAKGKEGTRGQKNAKLTGTHQDKANRPSPEGGTGAGAGNSQAPGPGNVDLFKDVGSRIENLLGNSAEKLGKGGEKLKGFGGFTTQGNGGLGLSGEGSGGGGNAETTLGGLGKKGIGGGRVGTGQGAAGSGAGIVGGKARVELRTGGAEETVVMGAIDADAVEAALMAHKDEFRLCYEKRINADTPKLSGRIGLSFVIGSSGRVNQAGVESTTINYPDPSQKGLLEGCVIDVIKRIDFPKPRGGGVVQVNYPFKYDPMGSR